MQVRSNYEHQFVALKFVYKTAFDWF